MSEEIRFYKGKYKVRVVNETKGYLTVEALEEFEDEVDGVTVEVRVGEKRIVPSNTAYKNKSIPQPVKEHSYELKMERKLKRMINEEKQLPKKKQRL